MFRNSKQRYYGIPVVASNMDTVGTFESALELAKVREVHTYISITGYNVTRYNITVPYMVYPCDFNMAYAA